MFLKRLLLLLLFFYPCKHCFSQNDLTGIWNGMFTGTAFDLGQPRLVVEIHPFKDSMFTGITHLYYAGKEYEHYRMAGRYFKKDSVLLFIESATISVNLGIYGNCLGKYMMKLKKEGDQLLLEGIWESNIKGCSPTSKVYLQKRAPEKKQLQATGKKKAPPKMPAILQPADAVNPLQGRKMPVTTVPSKEKLVKENAPVILPPQISQRETDIQSLLEIDPAEKDSIKVEVYDNGEIDGDSVSVYEGQALRVHKRMITEKPISFYVSLSRKLNPICHLRLVAESLGTIPPCTALMIVSTRTKRYEVRLSSNFSRNATVELFLKE